MVLNDKELPLQSNEVGTSDGIMQRNYVPLKCRSYPP